MTGPNDVAIKVIQTNDPPSSTEALACPTRQVHHLSSLKEPGHPMAQL